MYGLNIEYIILGLAGLCMLLLILVILLFAKISKLTKRYDTFMQGENAVSLEEQIAQNYEEMKTIRIKQQQQELDLLEITDRTDGSFNKMGIVKYDAFTGLGGKLSFAICILNDKKDGYILNCMQSQNGSYVYAKEIAHGKSNIELSPEEEEAFKKAL